MQDFHFPAWVNKFTLLLIFGFLGGGGYLAACAYVAIHPTQVNVGHAPQQPVPFSHRIHAGQLKLDCKYCHNTVDKWARASVPPTATCGNCHGADLVKKGATLANVHGASPRLEPVRESLKSNKSVEWIRVHDVPDFVYFNHAAHVTRGVSCVSCHGRVDKMDIVKQEKSLSMKFCLDCHRNPDPHIRPLEFVTKLDWTPPEGQDPAEIGKKIREELNINPAVNCSTCHR